MIHDERVKSNARRLATYYTKVGKIPREPCQKCGAQKSEKHHPDYSRPLEVEWLCRRCHRAAHAQGRGQLVSLPAPDPQPPRSDAVAFRLWQRRKWHRESHIFGHTHRR